MDKFLRIVEIWKAETVLRSCHFNGSESRKVRVKYMFKKMLTETGSDNSTDLCQFVLEETYYKFSDK
jgi:hypothetical protein